MMDGQTLWTIIQVILGSGIISSLVLWLTSRHKPSVDTGHLTVEFMSQVMQDNKDLRSRVDNLEAKVEDLQASVRAKDREVDRLNRDMTTVAEALWQQHEWQEAGATPPPPTIATAAVELLHRRRGDSVLPDG